MPPREMTWWTMEQILREIVWQPQPWSQDEAPVAVDKVPRRWMRRSNDAMHRTHVRARNDGEEVEAALFQYLLGMVGIRAQDVWQEYVDGEYDGGVDGDELGVVDDAVEVALAMLARGASSRGDDMYGPVVAPFRYSRHFQAWGAKADWKMQTQRVPMLLPFVVVVVVPLLHSRSVGSEEAVAEVACTFHTEPLCRDQEEVVRFLRC